VLPGVIKAGLIVAGSMVRAPYASGEDGFLLQLAAGSVGFQIGGEAKDIIIMFMTDAALKQFQASKGWEVGVDGNVASSTLAAANVSTSPSSTIRLSLLCSTSRD